MLTDLCVIMLIAAVTSLIFKLLRQPVVLGYIVAGIIIGPYVIGDSWISNEESVETWGEIGVLFLLFAMGLEFSFKKLLQMGSTALIAAGVIVVGMMGTGFLTGRLMGWNEMNSLFLGGMICMSSTTIVFKALDDMGLRSQKFAKICFSILVVEDIFAIILMVLLSSIATSRNFEGQTLAFEVVKLMAYLILWFFLGIVILPTFLRLFRKHMSDELLTILSVGLCLGMVLGLITCLFRLSNLRVMRFLAGVYIWIIRGTPMLVQALIIHFGIPQVVNLILRAMADGGDFQKFTFTAFASGVITLTLNAGAYLSEIFRGGIQAVPVGQSEAARSLGMTGFGTMMKIVLPQAFKIVIPSLVNQFIITIKDTSILSIIGLAELVNKAKVYVGSTYQYMETYLFVAVCYLVFTSLLMLLSRFVEKKLKYAKK